MLDTALLLNSLGMVPVVIPANQKGPTGDAWQTLRYTDDELRKQFRQEKNVGVLLGPSSSIIALDCDTEQSKDDILELFDGSLPSTPNWRSKRGGQYLFVWDDRLNAIGKAVTHWKDLEVRLGAGGKAAQSVLPPSTTDGFTREWIVPLSAESLPAKLPESVIQKLLAEKPKPVSQPKPKHPVDDDFCQNPDWTFMEECGWARNGAHFTRPGKDNGTSASIETESRDGVPLLHVFTTNSQLEARSYNAFDAYCILKHEGNLESARAELLKQGYGRLRVPLITSAQLDSNSYELEYLIPGILVAKQPCMVAGPKKGMKTSLLVALAIALATGRRFLDTFAVTRPCKVIILSGESGMATLQETARRICKSMEVRLADLANLNWSDWLPRLDNPQHLDGLERMIQETGCEVLIVDPAYLCMPGADASNLFIQGTLLQKGRDRCSAGLFW